jgi:hypothetical protein
VTGFDPREGEHVKIPDDARLRAELERRRAKQGKQDRGSCFYCAESCAETSTICDKCMGSRRHALAAWRERQAA